MLLFIVESIEESTLEATKSLLFIKLIFEGDTGEESTILPFYSGNEIVEGILSDHIVKPIETKETTNTDIRLA